MRQTDPQCSLFLMGLLEPLRYHKQPLSSTATLQTKSSYSTNAGEQRHG